MRKLTFVIVAMFITSALEAGIEQDIVIFFKTACTKLYFLQFFGM